MPGKEPVSKRSVCVSVYIIVSQHLCLLFLFVARMDFTFFMDLIIQDFSMFAFDR